MKIRLLATVSLFAMAFQPIGAIAHSAHQHGAAKAVKNGITIGGAIDWQAGYTSQDNDADQRSPGFRSDTEVHVTFRGESDHGFDYGAVIELEADVSEDAREEGINADKTYVFLETKVGRFELGSNGDAAAMLRVNAASFARATGGIHGDWELFASEPEGHSHGGGGHTHAFLHMPALPLHHMHGIAEDANKISYFTPRLNGFQFGISYLPDSGDGGQIRSGKTGHRQFENVVNAALQYQGKVNEDVSYALSLSGEAGNEEVNNHEDLKAYEVGGSVTYRAFTFGGSYGDWYTSVNHPAPNLPDGDFWNLGAAYDYGRGGASIGYLSSTYQGNDFNNLVFSYDYALAPGLSPYAEVSLFEFDHGDADVRDNDGTAIITGIQLNF